VEDQNVKKKTNLKKILFSGTSDNLKRNKNGGLKEKQVFFFRKNKILEYLPFYLLIYYLFNKLAFKNIFKCNF